MLQSIIARTLSLAVYNISPRKNKFQETILKKCFVHIIRVSIWGWSEISRTSDGAMLIDEKSMHSMSKSSYISRTAVLRQNSLIGALSLHVVHNDKR